jgi:hypothetical protein
VESAGVGENVAELNGAAFALPFFFFELLLGPMMCWQTVVASSLYNRIKLNMGPKL